MPFSIILNEGDLRAMDLTLRDALLEWYFNREVPGGEPSLQAPHPAELNYTEDANRRVTFPELVSSGFLQPGTEIYCKTLKRQRRQNGKDFISGARVGTDGSVEFEGHKFFKPSKLAIAMVNTEKRIKPAKALNGYVYLFINSSKGLVSLDELRTEFLQKGSPLGAGRPLPSNTDGHRQAKLKEEAIRKLRKLGLNEAQIKYLTEASAQQ